MDPDEFNQCIKVSKSARSEEAVSHSSLSSSLGLKNKFLKIIDQKNPKILLLIF